MTDDSKRTAQSGNCKNGHPWSEGNQYVSPTGKRACRSCRLSSEKRRQLRLAERDICPPSEAYCLMCRGTKPIDAFSLDRRRLTGVRPYCIACAADYNRRRTYGLSPAQYRELLSAQNGLCAVCDRALDSSTLISVDHDHKTGKVRGILCRPCNGWLERRKLTSVHRARAEQYLANPPSSRIIALAEQEWKIAGGAS